MIENKGVLGGQRDTDYMAGRVGASLSHESRNPSGDWTEYLPPGEWQRSDFADTMACVSFSAINSIEVQEKFLTGRQPNYSDRFIAVMSGTTRIGNYLWKVTDTIRKNGLVLEEEYPAPPEYKSWEEYHQMPPMDVINKAKLWLNSWDISYEWISITRESLLHHLEHAPLQIVINDNTHAVLEFLNKDDVHHYFDQYAPFTKQVDVITWALKIVLTKKVGENFDMKLIRESDTAKDIYAVANGKRYWVADPDTLNRGIDGAWGNWDSVVVEDPKQYTYGGQIVIAMPDSPDSR